MDEGDLPIIVACHGTGNKIALKICETGFAALSTLDSGFYGKGVYFTCYIPYIFPYVGTSKTPSMIISLVVPGNIYPVIESPSKDDNLLGAHIKTGYQSHYVKTNRNGLPCTKPRDTDHYDELVIEQEAQLLPIYLVDLDTSNFDKLVSEWQRNTADRRPEAQELEKANFQKEDNEDKKEEDKKEKDKETKSEPEVNYQQFPVEVVDSSSSED